MNVQSIQIAACAAVMLAAPGAAAAPRLDQSCAAKDTVGALHREAVVAGWEKKPGDPPFDFRAELGRYYDLKANNVHLYDDFNPAAPVARSADEYGKFRAGQLNQMRSARHSILSGPDIIVSGKLATSTLEYSAALEATDGKITYATVRSSLVWHCPQNSWKIVREHNSTRIAGEPPPSFQALNNRAVITAAFAKWAAGGKTFFDDVLAPNVVWTIKGTSPVAGTYRSRRDFLERAVAPFAARLATPLQPTIKHVWAEGDNVAVHWDGQATAADGKPYANSYVWIFRMDKGRAAEVTAYLDLVPYDAVLARVRR